MKSIDNFIKEGFYSNIGVENPITTIENLLKTMIKAFRRYRKGAIPLIEKNIRPFYEKMPIESTLYIEICDHANPDDWSTVGPYKPYLSIKRIENDKYEWISWTGTKTSFYYNLYGIKDRVSMSLYNKYVHYVDGFPKYNYFNCKFSDVFHFYAIYEGKKIEIK